MKKARPPRELALVGWREHVVLEDFGAARIKAKIDTGARTSALHAFEVERFERGGIVWVRFDLHPGHHEPETILGVETPLVGERWVRSSSGKATLRPVVKTRIALGAHHWPIEVTLVRRDLMGFRMLLGRRALRGRFLVDPRRSFLGGRALTGFGSSVVEVS